MLKFNISRASSTSKDPRNSYNSTRRRRSSQDSSYCINKIFTLTFPSASSNISKMYEVSLSSVSQFQLLVRNLLRNTGPKRKVSPPHYLDELESVQLIQIQIYLSYKIPNQIYTWHILIHFIPAPLVQRNALLC